MVQGWESRAHLANKRREEARERKQSKKGPQKLNGDVIINQLLKNDLIDLQKHAVEAWVENSTAGKAMCYAHFRAEACSKHKRCKYSHDRTISLNRGHQYVESEDSTPRSEAYMDCYNNIESIPNKAYPRLCLLFIDQTCVYDSQCPHVWQQWYERCNSQKSEAGLKTISEVDNDSVIPDDESVLSLDIAGDLDLVETACRDLDMKADHRGACSHLRPCPLYTLPNNMLQTLFSFVSDVDLCTSFATALTMKNMMMADAVLADRRKTYLQSVTLTGKELSKLRKQEKKKKQKQANLKDTKKGHKAVKVCRR
mmetsp:Transcript_922/g.1997  ORF Transcript_922/g.1997 Transcript_922/m.1997 type:complete len:311 (+) Transcript_922:102-1034(+)